MQDTSDTAAAAPRLTPAAARMVGLDSLRGLAILAVIAFHVGLDFPAGGVVGTIAAMGYNGVQLFFVVSAISMCYMWNQRRGEPAPVRSFLIRRLCRIAPPFWFGIVFYVLWRKLGLMGGAVSPLDVACTALFLHGFVPSMINLVVPGGWSIAVEVGFYLLFPLMILRLRSVGQRMVFAALCYAACTVAATAVRHLAGPSIEVFLYYSLLTQLPVFVVGMVVYSLAVERESVPWATLAVTSVCWLVVAWIIRAQGGLGRPAFWFEVFLMAVFSALIIGRFESRILAFAGRFSYSAYLFHFAVLGLLSLAVPRRLHQGPAAFAIAFALTCLGTTVIAWVSSKTLEASSIAYGRKLVKRLNASGVGSAAPV